jgi:hypothetical protein
MYNYMYITLYNYIKSKWIGKNINITYTRSYLQNNVCLQKCFNPLNPPDSSLLVGVFRMPLAICATFKTWYMSLLNYVHPYQSWKPWKPGYFQRKYIPTAGLRTIPNMGISNPTFDYGTYVDH